MRYSIEGKMSGSNKRQVRLNGQFVCYVRPCGGGFKTGNDEYFAFGTTISGAVDNLLERLGYQSRKDFYDVQVAHLIAKYGN